MQNLQVTEAIKNNQAVGKALAEKFKKEVQVLKSFNEEITLDDIKQLYTKLSKLEKSYEPLKRSFDNAPTDATLEYLANGGSAMLAYCRMQLKKEGILKSYSAEITQDELNVEQQLPKLEIQVAKSLNEELMQVTYVAMQEGTDAHGDYTDSNQIRLAKESFNRALIAKQKLANLFHLFETSTFDIIESYLIPCDATLGGNFVQKGSWLVTLQINDESLWEAVKKGYFVGVSIGALAEVEYLDE